MSNVCAYVTLIQGFLTRQMESVEFQRKYLKKFKNESEWFDQETYDALQRVFSSAEEFCADPALRSATSLDESQFRKECEVALRKLKELEG